MFHGLIHPEKKLESNSSSNKRRGLVRPRRYRPHLELLEDRHLPSASFNQLFTAQAYRDLLQREAEPAGLAFWSGLLDQRQSRP